MQLTKLIWVLAAILLTVALTSCNIGKAPEPTADVNAIYTSAAGTMIAQLDDQQTQTAQALPPASESSPTPLDTFTPLPTFAVGPVGSTPFGTPFAFGTPGVGGSPLAPLGPTLPPSGGGAVSFPVGCTDAKLIKETIPDHTVIVPAKRFTKTWEFLNNGTCAWDDGFSFEFKSGDQLQGQNVAISKNSSKGAFTLPGHSQSFNIDMWSPGSAGEYIGYWQMKNDAHQWFGSLVSVDILVHR